MARKDKEVKVDKLNADELTSGIVVKNESVIKKPPIIKPEEK